jgi:hypothetical protein
MFEEAGFPDGSVRGLLVAMAQLWKARKTWLKRA